MFGFFKSQCPLELEEKVWTERRMRWLADQLGIERLTRSELLLPEGERFPELFGSDIPDPDELLERLSEAMQVRSPVQLQLVASEDLGNLSGLQFRAGEDSPNIIRLSESLLKDPPTLIYGMVHELARLVLLGQQYLTGNEPDLEGVLDLAALFHGFGVFAANASLVSDHQAQGLWSDWKIERRGAIPSRLSGYALALYCYRRGETSTTWDRYLRLDAREALRGGLKFLTKTGDTLFDDQDRRGNSVALSTDRLLSSSPSVRMDELWNLVEAPDIDEAVVPALQECLVHREDRIRVWSARVLERHPWLIQNLQDDVAEGLVDSSLAVRARMFSAISQPGVDRTPFLDTIQSRLEMDTNRTIKLHAAVALSQMPNCPETALTEMLKLAKRLILDGDTEATTALIAAVLRAAQDGPERISEWLWELEGDPMLEAAQECHAEAQESLRS